MSFLTEFGSSKRHFLCITVHEWKFLMEKDLEQLKLVNYVISAILEISGKRANWSFTEFCSPKCDFLCIPVYKCNFAMARELESFKSINIVLYAILEILENSDISVILVL